MGYKWLPLTEDFDRSLPISKIRWDTSIYTYSGNGNGYLSEKPNIYADGREWNQQSGESWGYATENRFNCTTATYYQNSFANRYYGFTDQFWTASTYTTLVSGTTYEFVCPVPLYYAGLENAYVSSIAEKIHYYVEVGMSISTDSETVSANGSSFNVDITSENPWTASTVDSWVTLSTTTGLTDATITVTVAYNQFATRTGTITFTDGEDTLTLTVTQQENNLVPIMKLYRNGRRIN